MNLGAFVKKKQVSNAAEGRRRIERDAHAAADLDTFFEIALDMFCIASADGYFKRVNPAFAATLGWSVEDLTTRPFIEFVHPDDVEATYKEVERQMLAGEPVLQFENRYRHVDGSYRVLSWRSIPQAGGYMYAVARDVTEQRRDQEELRMMNQELEVRVEARTREMATQLELIKSLRRIDMAILGSVDLRVVLSVFLEQVAEQLHVDATAVMLLDPISGTLNYAAGRGFHGTKVTHMTSTFGKGCSGRVAAERCRVIAENLHTNEEFIRKELAEEEGFCTYVGVPLFAKGRVRGVLDVFLRVPMELTEDWLSFLETLAGQAAIAIDNATMFMQLESSHSELIQAYDATLEGWVKALDLRDHETEGHSQRVTELTVRLARKMGLSDAELIQVRRGALLHDVGKIGIPDHILLKPDKLNAEELREMQKHPVYAFEWLAPIRYLAPCLDIPYCHHERWDGSGYPRGLRGEQIPLAARIFSIVDVWDALRSDRPYRKAWSENQALQHIRDGAGVLFEPKVVAAFEDLIFGERDDASQSLAA